MNIETIECAKHELISLDFAAVKSKCKKEGGKTVREKKQQQKTVEVRMCLKMLQLLKLIEIKVHFSW